MTQIEGETVVPFIYDYFDWTELSFDELDSMKGVEVISTMHDYVVSEGMAAVMVGDKWGFIEIPQAD